MILFVIKGLVNEAPLFDKKFSSFRDMSKPPSGDGLIGELKDPVRFLTLINGELTFGIPCLRAAAEFVAAGLIELGLVFGGLPRRFFVKGAVLGGVEAIEEFIVQRVVYFAKVN